MDKHDKNLISELRRNARISLSSLSDTLGLTRATVRNRLDRLVSSETILGFTVVLKDDIHQNAVRGLMMLGIEGRGTDRITRKLNGIPEVKAIHSTNGKWDIILELGTETLEELDLVLASIRRIEGVTTSETNLLLATRMATSK